MPHASHIACDEMSTALPSNRFKVQNIPPHHFDITTLAHFLNLRSSLCCAAGGLEMTGNAPAGIGIDVPCLGHFLMFRGILAFCWRSEGLGEKGGGATLIA